MMGPPCQGNKGEQGDLCIPSLDLRASSLTGALSQPSLQAYQWGKVAPGGNMTLQCQTEDILTKHKVFLLLKEGTLSPTQPKILENDRAEFTLHNVTVSDSGYYSCVYHQAEAPFWASYPSNDLQILVTGKFLSLGGLKLVICWFCTLGECFIRKMCSHKTLQPAKIV
jgi:hypothetical protein